MNSGLLELERYAELCTAHFVEKYLSQTVEKGADARKRHFG